MVATTRQRRASGLRLRTIRRHALAALASMGVPAATIVRLTRASLRLSEGPRGLVLRVVVSSRVDEHVVRSQVWSVNGPPAEVLAEFSEVAPAGLLFPGHMGRPRNPSSVRRLLRQCERRNR